MSCHIFTALFNCFPRASGNVIPLGGPLGSLAYVAKKLGMVCSPLSPPTENTLPLYSSIVERGGRPVYCLLVVVQCHTMCPFFFPLPEIMPNPALILSPMAMTDLMSYFS